MAGLQKAAYLTALHTIELKECPIPSVGATDLLIRVKAVGICGSDIAYYANGRTGMGAVTFPHLLGHECAGEVVAAGKLVEQFCVGDRVAVEPGVACGTCTPCRTGNYNLCNEISFMSSAVVRPYGEGGMSEYILRPASFVHPLPDTVNYEQGAMAEPLSVALHAVRQSGIQPGQTAAIIGCGAIAACIFLTLRTAGVTDICMTDVLPERVARMQTMGAAHAHCTAGLSLTGLEQLAMNTRDVVFDTSCNELAINAGIKWLNKAGKLIQVGVPVGGCVLDVQSLFIRQGSVITSFCYANTYPQVISLLSAGEMCSDLLITHRFPLELTSRAMVLAASKNVDVMKIMLTV